MKLEGMWQETFVTHINVLLQQIYVTGLMQTTRNPVRLTGARNECWPLNRGVYKSFWQCNESKCLSVCHNFIDVCTMRIVQISATFSKGTACCWIGWLRLRHNVMDQTVRASAGVRTGWPP